MSVSYISDNSTSILPRVAFEYGHTWCAASTNSCACACVLSKSPRDIANLTAIPKPPSIAPIDTSELMYVSFGK